ERSGAPPCDIPERIFKAGEEPTGVRVTPYHKPCVSSVIRMLKKKTVTGTELRLKYAYLALLSSSSGSEDDVGEEEDMIDDENAEKKSISPGHARDIDAAGKAIVRSIISSGVLGVNEDLEFQWSDDEEDASVDNLLNLIEQGYQFTHSSFTGGVTKLDVIRLREETKAESLNRKTSKRKHSSCSTIPDGIDIEVVAVVVKDSVKDDFSRVNSQLVTLRESTRSLETQVLSDLKEMLSKVEECSENIALLSQGSARHPIFGAEGSHAGATPTACTANAATQTDIDFSTLVGKTVRPINHLTSPQVDSLDPALLFPKPSFSLGLTQEERGVLDKVVNACIGGSDEGGAGDGSDDIQVQPEEVGLGCRKSKRQKNPPKSLLGNYECDKRFLNLGRQAAADSNTSGGNIDYSAKFSILLDKMKTPCSITTARWSLDSSEVYEMVERSTPLSAKVVDVLISHISGLFRSNSQPNHQSTCAFLDSQFVYTKFSKVSKKESFRFPDIVLDAGLQNTSFAEADRYYFPFNLDNKYWVGVCVNMSTWAISVLDSNISIRSDYMMNKEIRPMAQMFPYFAKQLGKQGASEDGKPLAIERPRWIPQNNSLPDSAVSAILFIQAHAVAGVDGCKCITADVLDTEVEKLAVTLYEGNVGPL
ncbi:hypothetical protein HID58_051162, partial [Brassica napus]